MRLASSLSLLVAVGVGVAAGSGCSKSSTAESTPSVTTTSPPPPVDAAPAPRVPKSPGGDVGVDLVHARSATPMTKGLPLLAVSRKEIRLAGSTKDPLPLPPPNQWYAGMPLTAKGDHQGMLLVPVDGWLKELKKNGADRDVSLVLDATISYRITTEVIFTAARAGFDHIHLVVLSPDEAYGEMVIEMPGFRPGEGAATPFASILVAPEGISIKTEANNVKPGCGGFGVGLTFPRVNGVIDVIALPGCMDRIVPETGAVSPDVVVGANPEIPFGEVAMVIDGVRARKSKTIIHLGLPREPPPGAPQPVPQYR